MQKKNIQNHHSLRLAYASTQSDQFIYLVLGIYL